MPERKTLRDVARLAGVSEMTASRALRDKGAVSPATRDRIATIAAELGYVPNRIAGALASRTSNLVGVIVPSLGNFVFPEVLSGLTSALGTSRLQPVIGVSGYDQATEESVIREMLSWRPAGLVIAGLEHAKSARELLVNAPIPVVEIMDTDGNAIDYCVGISHLGAGGAMARAFVERGYRRIAYIGTRVPADHRAQKRLRGFRQALANAGQRVACERFYNGTSTIAKGRELSAGLLADHPDTDAIYYSSDVLAVGGLMHCLSAGVSVPGQLALAGFNDLELLNGLPLRIATTNSFRFETGQAAAKAILNMADGGGETIVKTLTFQPGVDPGQTI